MVVEPCYSPAMTKEFTAEAAELTEVCRALFGDESRWITANGYPNSLALCIIDSLWSTGPTYQSVQNVVSNYRAYRAAKGGKASIDGTKELLETFDGVEGSVGFAGIVKNRKPAHTRKGALLKAEVVHQAAGALEKIKIFTMADVRAEYARDEDLTRIEETWLDLPSQSSGVTFNYFVILAGYQSVKPDRMIYRFIEEHTGLTSRQIGTKQAKELIRQVADAYPTQARKLDHIIWRHVSGRDIFRADELS